ncbi:P44-1 outer membrane protein [Anaplasma phagocytophilum str. MRK]|uniref:P44/Msp2 family outer membrane protein n=1 Tax=Anaplasma phagocytophilum TaxID=948 RepID=UPI0005338974|nr:P44/Msp2 family outer membrane protein [Anaplasma phagocytophilum]KDB55243.1 P44-1 outer membrane protein [Anaplasma phagocytophilum str. MRK]
MRSFGHSVLFWSLGGVVMPLLVLMASCDAMARQGGYFYVGLDYSPTFVNIKNFSIGESSGGTKGIYPYLRDGDVVKLEAGRFDWNRPDPWIGFDDNMFVTMGGSAGYGMGNTRIEVEIGYERFKTKGTKGSRDTEDYADTVYLLAKDLAYNVASGKASNLAVALAGVSGKEIVGFADSLKEKHPGIDRQICKGVNGALLRGLLQNDEKAGNCDTGVKTQALVVTKTRGAPPSPQRISLQPYSGPLGLRASLGGRGVEKWPRINNRHPGHMYLSPLIKIQRLIEKTNDSSGYSYQRDASGTVANDIKELYSEAREIVAKLFLTAIEGAEVIEIKGISSTSFIVNVCSDIVADDFVAVPYACLGLGGNIIEFVEGRSDLRPAYKLKVGLSYQLAQKVNVFADVFYHRVLGNGEYSDLPVRHLVDDHSPEGRSKNAATANFSTKYTGAELGIQLRF